MDVIEQWKDFDKYKISNYGNVVNSKTGRPVKPHLNDMGYPRVALYIDGKVKNYKIARLVADLFIPNPNNLPEVNHKDENKLNSRVDNLEWCTRKENMNSYKENHPDGIGFEKAIYCFDLDKYFRSASEAAVHTGVCRTSIVKACRGQLTHAGGKLWCYAKDKDIKFTLQ